MAEISVFNERQTVGKNNRRKFKKDKVRLQQQQQQQQLPLNFFCSSGSNRRLANAQTIKTIFSAGSVYF
jgi:hypothetical protein